MLGSHKLLMLVLQEFSSSMAHAVCVILCYIQVLSAGGIQASGYFIRFSCYICSIFIVFFFLCLFAAGAGQTNTTARSNTAGETRAPPPAGLGGLALPDLEGMLGGMPDAASLNQMMQNPAVSQMMQSLLSNPQYMNQVSL